METHQIKQALENARSCFDIVQMGDDKIILSSEIGLEMLHSTISLVGEDGYMIQHPVVLYETTEQEKTFLEACNAMANKFPGIEFYDDPINKGIIAISCYRAKCGKQLLASIAFKLNDFVYRVKTVRDSLANIVLDNISPGAIDCPERSLFYLSLMPFYECPWGWTSTWGWQIDWNDVRTIWKKSKSVFFIPLMTEGNLYKNISDHIETFLNGDSGYLVAYFGLPYYAADTSDALGVEDMIRRFNSRYGCRGLSGIKMVDSLSAPPKIALVAILK